MSNQIYPSSTTIANAPSIINYEDMLSTQMSQIEKELINIALIPSDDIEIIEIEKKFPTIQQLRPELEAELDKNISECLRSYNSNYKFISKKYQSYSSKYLTDKKKQLQYNVSKKIESQEYEITDSNQQQLQNNNNNESDYDSFNNEHFNLLDSLNKENEQLRNKPRPLSLFKFYPVQQQNDLINVEFQMMPVPPAEQPCTKILVKCTQLKFELEIEPLWASMSLYDLKEKRKLSENFSFDLNTESIKHMLNTHQTHQDVSTTAKSCLFNITNPTPDIFLVIRIEKVLQQGDISECAESYVRVQSISQIEKLQLNASQFCDRLGKFRMPFVWTAVNIMNILNSAKNDSSEQKSTSLDRRSVKSNDSASATTTTINYDTDETPASEEDFLTAASKPSVLKNAYENFKKQSTSSSSKCTKTNSFRSMNETNNLTRFKPIGITVNTFFKQENDKLSDEDLFKFLADLKKPTNLIKKLKCVPGHLKMEFSPFDHDFYDNDLASTYPNYFYLTPELELIKQTNLSSSLEHQQQQERKQNHYHQPLVMHNHLLPVKDILEFTGRSVFTPNYIYRNILYIYPLSINLASANLIRGTASTNLNPTLNQQSSSARNIAIKINLMKGEEEHCALPVIFAKSSSTLEYHKEVYVNVIYHNKTPQYHDEIKIKLPAILNESNANYHLLFTFYHVSCQSNKDSNQLESIIGYSWLPLQQNFQFETSNDQTTSTTNNIDSHQQQQQTQQQKISSDNHCTMVKNGTYTLPICSEKLPVGYSNLNYSNYSNNENIEQTATTNENEENESSIPNNNSDNHNHNTILNNLPTINSTNNNLISLTKSFFDIRLNLISTIHTQDVYLERFIHIKNQQTNNIDATILKRTIQDLHLADSDALVKFVFIIMDKLFHLSVQMNCLSIYCLEAISKIILKINGLLSSQQDSHKRNRILVQYVKYACNLPLDFIETQCLFHEHLIQELINILKNKNNTSRDLLIQTMWFFLEILFKALTFYLNRATNHFKMYRTKQQIKQHSFNLFCTKFLSQKFLNDLECLIQLIISELIDYKNKDDSKDTLLNCALTFFINDLLSLIDRNFIFHRLIDHYFKETNKMLNHLNNLLTETKNILNLRFKQIHSMQLDFLRIISSNEHFLALNLPIFPNLLEQQQQQQRSRLVIETNEYFSIHYLIGLVLKQTFKSIHSAIPCIQFKAIQVIRNLFEANDLDPRLDTYKSRTHIAFMYMPFMNLFIHFMPLMIKKQQSQQRYKQQDIFSNKENNGGCCLNSKKNDFDLLNDVLSEPELDLSNESLAGDFEDCDLFDCANDLDNLTENTTDIDLESMNIYETENFIDGFVLDNQQQQQQQQIVVESKNFLSKNSIQRKSQRIKPTISTSSVNSSSVKIIQKQHLTNNKYACCDFYNFKIDESDTGLLNTESTQDLLVCFLWILKNIGYELLFKIWSRWSLIRLKKVLALIDLCISHFEYKSSVWSDLSKELKKTASQISTSTASIKNLLNKNNKFINSNKAKINDLILNNKNNNNNNNMNKSEFIKRAKYTNFDKLSIFDIINDSKILDSNMSDHDRTILESNLSTECNLILLDSIEIIIEVIQHQNSLPSLNVFKSFINKTETSTHLSHHNLLKSVMKVILNMLSIQPSTRTLPNLFSLQRDFVSKFSDLLFESDTDYCSDMCTLLLRHCTSQLNAVRVQASASMYFLMRQNFDIGNNFARVKQQLTMSLSSLVTGITSNNNNEQLNKISADSFNTYNIAALKSSLKTILINADSDTELIESTFPCQVKDLIINLNTILSDTIKMKDYSDDHDMILDLMHRIANCYANSPDMRLIWLQNMAQKHLERQNLVEAGQCLVHAAALIAEYLSMIENKSYLPVGCASFKNVSINVLEESAISDDVVVHSSLDGVCTGKYFTETGLIGLIEQAAVFLVHSQNYEASNQLYKILIPIYEYHRDIKKLSQVHSKLHDCFNKILINGSRRLFGTYFRVGFYGHSFNELNGEEFVYKEPGITKLAEIAHRLENYYTEKFGDDIKVEIMKDSNNVDKKQLDLVRKAYIQITYVEPYFDRWESQKCVTYFEKNYSLKRFIYSTPFTLEGKAHGALNDQYKRKTILTTERAFPYVKIRIPVIDKQQIILTPVEVAIEDLQKKIDELRNAIYQEPSDPKILQMVLQGCVGTTVNQGPLEMALTFLQPTSIDAINEHHNKLRLCFKEFSRRCLEALKKNKLLIGPDQYEYQREMERNYNEFSSKIDPLIENKLFKNL